MFEGWILGLLNRLLGEYVKEDCLSRDRLRADVYNGHVCLEQLELRESAFDFLNEPVTLIKGYIGQVELKVSGGSWTNIMSKPVEVWFDRIHLLLSPKFDWDEDDREEREQQIKQALLRRAELFAMHRASQKSSSGGSATGAPDHSGGDSFIERLMTKLVDNVEFHVRNVHIRYEDHLSNPLQIDGFCTLEQRNPFVFVRVTGPDVLLTLLRAHRLREALENRLPGFPALCSPR